LVHAVCAREMFEKSGRPGVIHMSIEGLIEDIVKFSAGGIRAYANDNGA